MTRRLARSGWALLCLYATLAARPARGQQPPLEKPQSSASLTASWTAVGPASVLTAKFGVVTGRVTALAADPNDASGNTVYMGSTGGGVWKSTNAAGALGAVTFAPLTDTLPVFAATSTGNTVPSLSIGALAVQPAANGVVLAGTGDPNGASDSFYGEGLLRSADAGLTWTLSTGSNDGVNGKHSFAGLATAGVAWSTASPSVVVAAMTNSPQSAIAGAANSASVAGLYYSTDAGATWRMATIYDGAQIVQQPLLNAQPSNPATAVLWDAARASFFAALRFHGYYTSTDGATWTRLAAQPGTGLTAAKCPANAGSTGSVGCPLYRGALAVQPDTGDLYALSVDAANTDQGLWQDLCSPGAGGACAAKSPGWGVRLDGGALEVGSGSSVIVQGSYNLALGAAAAANGATALFAGTQDLYRCLLTASAPSACTWRNTTHAADSCATPAGVAAAQHALALLPQQGGTALVFLGNDGGLWRSTDGVAQAGSTCSATDASHFDNLNPALAAGGSLAEVVGLAQEPADGNALLAGLGATGTAATGTAASAWPQVSSTEGGQPLIDADAPANWFAAIGAGVNLKFCAKGASCTAGDFLPPATTGAAQVAGDAALLHAPLLLDPAQTTNLLTGTCRVWRGPAADGTLWSAANALSPAFGGGTLPCTASSALVRSLSAGGPMVSSASLQNSGSTVLYAGMAGTLNGGGGRVGGHVFVTRTANTATSLTSWTDAGLSPVTNVLGGVFNPGGYDVSAVTVDPHDTTGATVYAAVMGFGGDVAVPHLYRSTDFGAHWITVSANLPAAPANAVVIDPNDANTVYVATDAGVFATQAITTCASQSCWSVLGTGLPNSPATTLAAGADLPTGDGRRGMLRAGTYGRGIWQQPLLTAIGVAQAAMTLSPSSLSFPSQAVGTQSVGQTVTVTSSGNAPLVFGTPAITGDFVESDTCAGKTVAVGAACIFSVQFVPSATGSRSGVLTIYANVSGGQSAIALTGTGTAAAAIVLNPTTVSFLPTTVNQTTGAQVVNIANTGGTAATLASVSASGDFAIGANTCAASLPSQTACAVSITFTPTTGGTRLGALTVSGSAGTQTATLTGVGQSPPTDTLTPASLVFAQQPVGSASAAQLVTLANAGDQALTLLSSAVSGDFTAVNGCGTTLPAHASCAVSVQFVPAATGTRSGVLTVADAFRTQTVSLVGTGVAPPGVSLTPILLSFGPAGVGLLSPPQAVTLTNNGGLPLSLTGVSISSGFVLAGNGCGSMLAVADSCTMQVVFAPAAAGSLSGTLLLTDNAPSHTQTVNLAGTGIDFALTPNGATTATLASGTTAMYPLLLTSLGTLSGNVALACTGAPAHSHCTVSPGVSTLGASVNVTVTVQTGLAQARLEGEPRGPRPSGPGRWLTRGAVLLACVLPAWLWRRRRHTALLCGVLLPGLLGAALLVTGCSASRVIPGDGGTGAPATPTAAGTYTLTVSATGAGVTHAVPLTLIVQ